MSVRVIVLNGGSSSGKSSIARCLQSSLLPDLWLLLGVDTLVEAMPASLWGSPDGIALGPDGAITSGPAFRTLQSAWSRGIAAIAHAGVSIILDEVFLAGAAAQARWRTELDGLPILWVGIRCDPAVASAREATRSDRMQGMAASQADLVHQGVAYDLQIDTTHAAPQDCAQLIIDRLAHAARHAQTV